ncbi:MAG: CBS domain-containing protein [Deltaproteobacteria bacterium]|nr:MAG: CBS domain-containing protein [Deltaproteobacteria bacterium]
MRTLMDATNTASNQPVRETVAPGLSTVAEIMSVSVRSLTPDRPIADAVAAFNEYGFRHMLIVDETGGLVGVLSDRDVLRAMARGVSGAATVSEVMTRGGITVTPESPITDAIDLVVFHRINCLPVVDANGALRGLLTTTDLLGALHEILHQLRPRVRG